MPDKPHVSAYDAALHVLRTLREAGFEAYFAGGCVRDRLLGRAPGDYDVATNAVPDQVQRLFRRTIAVGKQFGVIIVLHKGREVEVATFRADAAYSDGRHPDRVTFSDLKSDVLRRDFTINGMMEDPVAGDVVDLVGGRADLQAHVIRAIGDPDRRFDEDRLRMLRAVRFAAQLDFGIEPATLAAVRRRAAEVSSVSRERVREELEKILAAPGVGKGLSLLRGTGLLAPVVPGLAALDEARWERTVRVVTGLAAREFRLSMAALLHDLARVPGEAARLAEGVARDLKLSNDERERIVWLVARRRDPARGAAMPASEWKPLLAHPGAADMLELFRSEQAAEGASVEGGELFRSRLGRADLDPPRLLSGDDVMALGVSRGPGIGRVLQAVRDAQLDGRIASVEEARDLARRLAAGESER